MGWGRTTTGSLDSVKDREARIRHLLQQNPVSLDALRELALSRGGGFVSNDLRQVIWPKLLGLNRFEAPPYRHFVGRENRWSEQVR